MVHKLTDAEVERLCCRQEIIKQEAAAENMALDDRLSSGSKLGEIHIKSEVPDAELEAVTVKDEPIDWDQEFQASSSSGSYAVTFKREVDCTEARSGPAEAQDEVRESSSGACNKCAVHQGPAGSSEKSAASPPSDVPGSGSGVEAAPPDTLTSRPLLCAHCDYSTGKKNCMRLHLRVRHNLGCYQCELCAYSTKNKSAFKRHVREQHDNENQWKGLFRSYQYSGVKMIGEQQPERHVQEEFECEVCGSIIVMKSSSEAPEKGVLDNRKVSKCEMCENSSANEANLKQCLSGKREIHQISKHRQGQLRIRILKDHASARKNDHEVHHVCNDGKSQLFRCEYFSTVKKNVEQHLATKHGKGQLFRCELCEYFSARRDNLKLHLASKHGGEFFMCELCDYSSAHKGSVKVHLASKHGKGQLLKCGLCDYSNALKRNVEAHRASKHGKGRLFRCELCDYSSAYKGKIKLHRASKHGEGQFFKCKSCEYFSARKAYLKQHLASKHGQGQLFKCELCDYSSAQKGNVKLHRASKHGEGQIIRCELCEYSSVHKSNIKQHRASKHGEGQFFKCESCEYFSARKAYLKQHLASKHGQGQLSKCH